MKRKKTKRLSMKDLVEHRNMVNQRANNKKASRAEISKFDGNHNLTSRYIIGPDGTVRRG